MKKKKISKLIIKISCVALLTTVLISAMVVPSFAWTWTNSEPKDSYQYGTNSYSFTPITSAEYSMYSDSSMYKTYTLNAPSEVSFEYGNGFTAGYELGREITVGDDNSGFVGIRNYLGIVNSFDSNYESDNYSLQWQNSYFPYADSLNASTDTPQSRIDYQTLGYNALDANARNMSGRTSFSIHMGTTYLTLGQWLYGNPLHMTIDMPYETVTLMNHTSIGNGGIRLSFDYSVWDMAEEDWVFNSFEYDITFMNYAYDHAKAKTIRFVNSATGQVNEVSGATMTINLGEIIGQRLYEHVEQWSAYNPSDPNAKAKPIMVENIMIDSIPIDDTQCYSGICSMKLYHASYRPIAPPEGESFPVYDVTRTVYTEVAHQAIAGSIFDPPIQGGGGNGGGGITGSEFISPFITTLVSSCSNFFSVEVLPNISLGAVMMIPICFLLLLYILKLFAGG